MSEQFVIIAGQLALSYRSGKCGGAHVPVVPLIDTKEFAQMKRSLIAGIALLTLAGCGQGAGDDLSAADTLTRAQKDSIVATLPIPGASAVGRALGARDVANARTLAHDSIG